MPKALEVRPSDPPPQDPYTQLFLSLIVDLPFNCFFIHILCLAQLICPRFLTNSIVSKRVRMTCLVLSCGPEPCQFSHKIIYFVYKPLDHGI